MAHNLSLIQIILVYDRLELTNKPLTNFEIIDAGKKLKIPRFRGVFVRDNLPYNPKKMNVVY